MFALAMTFLFACFAALITMIVVGRKKVNKQEEIPMVNLSRYWPEGPVED